MREGQHGAFAARFRQRFGDAFALLTIDEVDRMRLLGAEPMSSETRRRLGDYLAVSLDHDALLYEPHDTLRVMKGFHGGLLPAETRIPLIVV